MRSDVVSQREIEHRRLSLAPGIVAYLRSGNYDVAVLQSAGTCSDIRLRSYTVKRICGRILDLQKAGTRIYEGIS
jgi:hypothetical protein